MEKESKSEILNGKRIGCTGCYSCQLCIVAMTGTASNEEEPPDINDFVRVSRKRDGHLWLILPRWLEKIIRFLCGWWLKSSAKER